MASKVFLLEEGRGEPDLLTPVDMTIKFRGGGLPTYATDSAFVAALGEPLGTNYYQYYNSTSGIIREYVKGTWRDQSNFFKYTTQEMVIATQNIIPDLDYLPYDDETVVIYVGGVPQFFGDSFTVSGKSITWISTELDVDVGSTVFVRYACERDGFSFNDNEIQRVIGVSIDNSVETLMEIPLEASEQSILEINLIAHNADFSKSSDFKYCVGVVRPAGGNVAINGNITSLHHNNPPGWVGGFVEADIVNQKIVLKAQGNVGETVYFSGYISRDVQFLNKAAFTVAAQTLDATSVAIAEWKMPEESQIQVEIRAMGQNAAGTEFADFKAIASFSRQASSDVVLDGSWTSLVENDPSDSWGGLDFVANTVLQKAQFMVEGKAATTINWQATFKIINFGA